MSKFFQKIKIIIKKPKILLLYLMYKKFLFWLPDKQYLKLEYKLILGKKLNLEAPKTFNEKLQWLKLYDRNPLYTKLVDKYEVRNYVKEKVGDEYLIPLYGVYNNFDEINFKELPSKFVIKPNHTSGNVFICKNKNNIDYKKLKRSINKWLKREYYHIHREWPYKNVKPKIIAEQYLDELDGDVKDYKFFIFNGKFAYSFVCSERSTGVKFTFFDKNAKFMNMTQDHCPNDKNVKLPKKYNEMIKLAEKLAEGIPQVRVDFYEINDKIYFGELTFFDSAGFGEFEPECWDFKIGKMLKLPERK